MPARLRNKVDLPLPEGPCSRICSPGAAASVWPETLPVQSLRYEGQQLTLSAAGLTAAQAEPMRQRLAPAGWALEASDGRIALRRAPTGGPK
mgnify:CR=1 FL=1